MKESAGSILSGPEKNDHCKHCKQNLYFTSLILNTKFHYQHRHCGHCGHHVSPVAGDGERDGESVRDPGDEIELILLSNWIGSPPYLV